MQKELSFIEILFYTSNLLTRTDRVVDLQHVDKTEAEAWNCTKQASDEYDITDFKEALQVLIKACPDMTYTKLEKDFRNRGLNVYLIGLVSLADPSSSVRPPKRYCSTGEKSWRYIHFP